MIFRIVSPKFLYRARCNSSAIYRFNQDQTARYDSKLYKLSQRQKTKAYVKSIILNFALVYLNESNSTSEGLTYDTVTNY